MNKRRLSKGDLCRIFGLYSRSSGIVYYQTLRNDYFTDEDLEALGITRKRYNNIKGSRQFSFAESRRIIEYFKIESYEIDQIES
ncbi:MAG: hypothetical protein KDC34_19105 [Saprospiraceae bacterium]|nr:hypothetical protein [Saprospiraceae bacterium]